MARPTMNPRPVDWAGENPGMYLKARADGPFVTLVSFFRVVLSPHGKGHAAILALDPTGDGSDPARPNVCVTDNEPLAAYLRDGFAQHFLAFRGSKVLSTLKMVPGWDFVAGRGCVAFFFATLMARPYHWRRRATTRTRGAGPAWP